MKTLLAIALGLLSLASAAAPVEVENLRMWQAPEKTRLVFDISGPLEHALFTLAKPDRVVVDLRNAKLAKDLQQPNPKHRMLEGIRTGNRKSGDLRVVLDLKGRVRPKSFLLRPNRNYGHRLVIDLHEAERRKPAAGARPAPKADALRDVVVAIDAGHGGEDPGAHGQGGTNEKKVVMQIARRVAQMVTKEKGMRPVLVRDGDYYIGLRKRMKIARKAKADLFISIHADAFRDSRVHGSSVYVLSRNGASSEAARWLAERENAADLIGGVSLDNKDDLLASVLLDLSQTATLEASLSLGDHVLKGLRKLGKVHKRSVQQAGFMVLKSPDIPSILIETAFISNPAEERRLRSPTHQQKLARSIFRGVKGYFSQYAPPGTYLAARDKRNARLSKADGALLLTRR